MSSENTQFVFVAQYFKGLYSNFPVRQSVHRDFKTALYTALKTLWTMFPPPEISEESREGRITKERLPSNLEEFEALLEDYTRSRLHRVSMIGLRDDTMVLKMNVYPQPGQCIFGFVTDFVSIRVTCHLVVE